MTTTTAIPFPHSRAHLLAGLAVADLRVRWAVHRARAGGLDPDDAFRGLYLSDQQINDLLGQELGRSLWPHANGKGAPGDWAEAIPRARAQWEARAAAGREAGTSLRLTQLARRFALDDFEVDALLLTLAPELDTRYERLYAYLQDDVTRKRPSVDLLLNLLCADLEQKLDRRAAFSDAGVLLRQKLLHRFPDANQPEAPLLAHFLRPAPAVAAFLLEEMETALAAPLRPYLRLETAVSPPTAPHLPPDLIDRLHAAAADRPLFTFRGGYGVGKLSAARHLAAHLEQPLLRLDLARLVADKRDLGNALRLLARDGRLHRALLYLDGWDALLEDLRPPAHLLGILLAYPHVAILAGETAWQPTARRRPILHVAFPQPDYQDRERLWRHYAPAPDLELRGVVTQFRFAPGQIADAAATARDLAHWHGRSPTTADLFAASRAHSNQKLANMATKIRPHYDWDDIILPPDTRAQLREMVNVVWERPRVYDEWGFDRKLALGKGLSALFSGKPGTGKTMAADIIAGELGLDLYKIDLSTVVSKYIGETEKNLERIFSEAATSNAILFFDEADAIFGKRSEVKDSHDRYANIEISYLLQRMEQYDGVVILATNLQANLDEAFTRRFHFITEFPFPEAADRARIWRVNVPPETPIADEVDFDLLARRFRIAGGNIRNIILAAAFLAAREDTAVHMRHLLHATRREFQKMGRLIDDAQFAWP